MTPGLFTMPAADYLADPVQVPSLSSSIARILLMESPRHAHHAHSRLNLSWKPKESDKFDLGSAVHAYLLENDSTAFAIVNAKDWTTKAAKEAKALARATGQIPILADQLDNVHAMAKAVCDQLSAFEIPVPLVDGEPEQTIVWEEDGAWCRARLDWLTYDRRVIFDLKSTKASAHPDSWSRYMFNAGLDMQAGFYLRGIRKLFGIEAEFRFVVAEIEPPYAVSVIALAPDALALADRKVSRAINLWRECMLTGDWPGFPTRTAYVEAPPWGLAKWEDSSEFSEKSIVLEGQP